MNGSFLSHQQLAGTGSLRFMGYINIACYPPRSSLVWNLKFHELAPRRTLLNYLSGPRDLIRSAKLNRGFDQWVALDSGSIPSQVNIKLGPQTMKRH